MSDKSTGEIKIIMRFTKDIRKTFRMTAAEWEKLQKLLSANQTPSQWLRERIQKARLK
jgi:hypothetical protein